MCMSILSTSSHIITPNLHCPPSTNRQPDFIWIKTKILFRTLSRHPDGYRARRAQQYKRIFRKAWIKGLLPENYLVHSACSLLVKMTWSCTLQMAGTECWNTTEFLLAVTISDIHATASCANLHKHEYILQKKMTVFKNTVKSCQHHWPCT